MFKLKYPQSQNVFPFNRFRSEMFWGANIGLLGGSFDPPHEGHLHITREALRTLNLCQVIWIVSPGNPLKQRPHFNLNKRVQACKKLTNNERVHVSCIEDCIGTKFTADTLRVLVRSCPNVRFIWLMGTDNLQEFHRWQEWSWIMENIHIAVMPRPGTLGRAGLSQTAKKYAKFRINKNKAKLLTRKSTPRWVIVDGSTCNISSTLVRRRKSD